MNGARGEEILSIILKDKTQKKKLKVQQNEDSSSSSPQRYSIIRRVERETVERQQGRASRVNVFRYARLRK